jgi:predicted dinucleotide-binding enzyme
MPGGMTAAILGVGAVGARTARQLASSPDVDHLVLRDPDTERLTLVAESLGPKAILDGKGADEPVEADVVVLAGPTRGHLVAAEHALRRHQHVVSLADAVPAVRSLMALEAEARERGVTVAIGAGFAPGLTCVLASHLATWFDQVDEVHVAKVGTGGPACAREHHRALRNGAVDWRDGAWLQRPGGSGRELCWFPDPIGAQDCYRAALPDALLLVEAFADVRRVTARVGATRRDRLTAQLPMLWPTHPEGGPGAVRVEVRGRRGQTSDVAVVGVMDRPAVAGGAVAAVVALWAVGGQMLRTGAGGLASLVEPLAFLTELQARGVRAARFEGSAAALR